jgi:Polysulphide reductase, NrfD
MTKERRLEQLREQAWEKGVVTERGVDIAGGPIPRKAGYYGQPVVKPPVWTWEIPVYFFVGGLSGMAAVIAFVAALFRHVDLARMSIFVAAVGAGLSPILLTMDLGRPRLFLNMLRVFKYKSPMSVGAWIVFAFGACAVPGLLAIELHARHVFIGGLDQFLRVLAALISGSAFWGMLLATYTGVLLGATAIPAWFLHRIFLPIHFGAAGLGSAAALLELLGHRIAPLNAIGFLAAGIETALWIWLEINRHGAADRALHTGHSGWLIRSSEILSGPLALILRLANFVPLAGISFLLGAFLSRFGWIEAGKVCACDPEAVFLPQRAKLIDRE